MNCIIPFESRVEFNGPIKEICSISLEHEITQNPGEILGNFLISGTYKEYELSMTTKDFNFTIPFNVEITNRILEDTLEFSIDNFTYDLKGKEMIIKIDYIVCAEDEPEDIILEDPLDLIEEEREEIIPVDKKEPVQELDEEREIINYEEALKYEDDSQENDNHTQMVNYLETENDYMTYHIHIVKEEESLENIMLKYKVTKEDLDKTNDLSDFKKGLKLIIPMQDE